MIIPFSFAPPKLVTTAARNFKNVGAFLASLNPNLKQDLIQAEYGVHARDYCAIAFVASVTNMLVISLMILVIGLAARIPLVAPAVFGGLIVAFASFFTITYYPRIISTRRGRELDEQLIPALRQLLIELKSGVPLFNAMASVSNDYGEVSEEFKKIVKRINGGTRDLDALAEATTANPSLQFRKVLWQISNALKVGSDVGRVLESLVRDLTLERMEQIKRYGQELSPWTMIYMMTAVILPSLGITMLMVIMSFLNVAVPSIVLPLVIVFLVGFQLFFMNFVSTRRPKV
ncbi:MAG: type II secretion system F family protein [Candidatus Micrarchaeia archaeon]